MYNNFKWNGTCKKPSEKYLIALNCIFIKTRRFYWC